MTRMNSLQRIRSGFARLVQGIPNPRGTQIKEAQGNIPIKEAQGSIPLGEKNKSRGRTSEKQRLSTVQKQTIREEKHEAGRQYLEHAGALELILDHSKGEIEPDFADLQFLHQSLVKSKSPRIVLEFGVGYSTVVMAHAIASLPGDIRAKSKIFSVDTSSRWIDITRGKIPEHLVGFVELTQADAIISDHQGQICSIFEKLPNIRPNLIYLDGPDPTEVKGSLRGLTFVADNGRPNPPLAADILLYEWLLARGTCVIIDGRNLNARFLQANLKRNWTFSSDAIGDRHVFQLKG